MFVEDGGKRGDRERFTLAAQQLSRRDRALRAQGLDGWREIIRRVDLKIADEHARRDGLFRRSRPHLSGEVLEETERQTRDFLVAMKLGAVLPVASQHDKGCALPLEELA